MGPPPQCRAGNQGPGPSWPDVVLTCTNLHWKSPREETGLPAAEKSVARPGSLRAGRDRPAQTRGAFSGQIARPERLGPRKRCRELPWFEHSSSPGPCRPRSQEALCLPHSATCQGVHQVMPTGSNRAAIAPACKNIPTPTPKPQKTVTSLTADKIYQTPLNSFWLFLSFHTHTHTCKNGLRRDVGQGSGDTGKH